EAPAPVLVHRERRVARDRGQAAGIRRRTVIRRPVSLEVGDVVAGPSLRRVVPPDELLPLRPGPSLGIGRGAVVEDAAIGRPRPCPTAVDRVAPDARILRAGQVRLHVGEDAAIEPAAAGRRAITGQLTRSAELPPLAPVASAD